MRRPSSSRRRCCSRCIRTRTTPGGARSERADVVRELREGIAAVFGTPWLAITIGVIALTNVTLGGPFQVALPFLVGPALRR